MTFTKQLYILIFIILSAIFVLFANDIIHVSYKLMQVETADLLKKELSEITENFHKKTNEDVKQFFEELDKTLKKEKYESIKIISAEGKELFAKHRKKEDIVPKENCILKRYSLVKNQFSIPLFLKNNSIIKLTAKINKEYIQKHSWQHIKHIIIRIFYLFLVALLISFSLLYIILKPLRKIIFHAKKISKHEFFIEEDLPVVPIIKDMNMISEGLNLASLKLKKLFNENNEFSQLMRINRYQDKETKFFNEHFFENNLEQMLSCSESGIGGLLFMLKVDIVERNEGIVELISHHLRILSEEIENIEFISHFGDLKFVFIVKNILPFGDEIDKKTSEYSEIIIKDLSTLNLLNEKILAKVYIGVTEYQQGTFVVDLISQVEDALSSAINNGESGFVKYKKPKNVQAIQDANWGEYLPKILEEENYMLQYQPVYYYEKDGTILFHNESLMRIKGQGKEFISSGTFLPLVFRENLGAEYDVAVIKTVLEVIKENVDGWQRYGINLSHQSLRDKAFFKWLKRELNKAGDFSKRLSFEFTERTVVENLQHVKNFIKLVSKYGIQVGIDHFGCSFSDHKYLESLNVKYIKVDGSYTRRIQNNPDNQAIIRSFVELAHCREILVFATCVETEEERETLNKLHVDGLQGFWIGQPI